MRVVEMGKLPEKEIVCERCNSTLAYTQADVEFDADDYFGEMHSCTKIKCPVCGNVIILTIDGEAMGVSANEENKEEQE